MNLVRKSERYSFAATKWKYSVITYVRTDNQMYKGYPQNLLRSVFYLKSTSRDRKHQPIPIHLKK